MSEKKQSTDNKQRSYPGVYEKAIPIVIAVIAVLIIGMLLLTIGIATGVIAAG